MVPIAARAAAGLALAAGFGLAPAFAGSGWAGGFERLHYRVSWGFLTAGKAIIQARSPRPGTAELLTETCADGALDALYESRDRLLAHSRMDGDRWRTEAFRTARRGEDGRRVRQYRFSGDGVVHIRDLISGNTDYLPADAGTLDVLTALYAIRSRTLRPGRAFTLPVLDRGEPYRLHVRVGEPERRQTLLGGRTRTVRVHTYLEEEGTHRRKRPLRIWFTANARHLPVRLVAKAPVGRVTLDLIRIQHRPPPDPQAGLPCN